MAKCEKCGKNGFDMRDMRVDGVDTKMFVGPCCYSATSQKMIEPQDVSYGIEISSHMGIRAYASYGGLTLEFRRSKEEINKWFQETQETKEPVEVPPPTVENQPTNTTGSMMN